MFKVVVGAKGGHSYTVTVTGKSISVEDILTAADLQHLVKPGTRVGIKYEGNKDGKLLTGESALKHRITGNAMVVPM